MTQDKLTQVEAGDELTIEYEDERTGDEGQKTVTAQRVNDEGKIILATEDGEEFGYIVKVNSNLLDEVARMETFSHKVLATIYSVEIVGDDSDEELEEQLEAKREARDAMEGAGREGNVERLESEIAELEGELDGGDDEREETEYADTYDYETADATDHGHGACPNCGSETVAENTHGTVDELSIECAGCGRLRGEPEAPTLEEVRAEV